MPIPGQIASAARESTTHPGLIGESLLDRIGNTPLLRLERVGREFPNVEFCAKAEWSNPGGSVKDRPALSMIQAGIASGALRLPRWARLRRRQMEELAAQVTRRGSETPPGELPPAS